MSVVIIGAGQAAAQLVASLRQGGYAGAIRMIGDEPYAPYQRPPLSKKFLTERPAAETLYFRAENFWREQGVTLDVGTPVAAVDRAARRVKLADGRSADYETLVLATGTRARGLPVPGAHLPGVFSLRKIDDVRRLRGPLDEARRVVIVGGGYIGLEVAAVVRGEGREVAVLEAEERVMKRVTSPVMSTFMQDVHRGRGVDVRLGARLAGVEGEGRVREVRLADGTTLPADLVLMAVGARPNDDLAQAAGLACQDGVVVDAHGRTADTAIYAAGDCTRFPSRRYGRALRLECVQNAIDQAKAVAAAILGKPQPYDPVPWFWSDQYELKLQMAGLSDGYDDAQTVGEPAAARFSVEYRKDGRLIAVDAVNDGRAYMGGRKRIAQETEAAVA
ncbi:MAG: 3-phenylpropionate/trans-cinnamate dioxygenase ferredoxin reductase component [Hyphomicrobiales bacterium]|jgi:3-phenylpropionate/trans-cinnamate dioxygenase ferredoxin reductase subunit|nr:3-phenylpropionate/trans-cinnamate dioxygenase ferredoxin reductase component [Hyphomicrobiales bacterium]